ncbi:MAG: YqaJ viral recombinase family protein [Clostridia bacterium]|jgi:putative phage-type endonuclease|nr:YqaJ viral recombinase family protein [Clostridia bacterium]MDY0184108.1 YqaJ viral recombinase family protein [Proteiniphilum sp.]
MGYTRKQFKSESDWLGGRIIGGSGASAIVGENPYKTNVDYFNSMIKVRKGFIAKDNISNLDAVQFGKKAESPIRYLYALLNKDKYDVIRPRTVEQDGYIEMLVSDEHPFMTATLDGELIEKGTNRKGILEVKTSTILNTVNKEKWRDTIPNNYFIQILHYLLVKDDAEFVELVAYLVFKDDKQIVNTYHFERADFVEEIEKLKKAELEFWQQLETNQKPSLILTL